MIKAFDSLRHLGSDLLSRLLWRLTSSPAQQPSDASPPRANRASRWPDAQSLLASPLPTPVRHDSDPNTPSP
jgi:hypothetical protein